MTTNTLTLTDDQQKAFDHVMQSLHTDRHDFIGLFGYAGTGKTTIVSEIIKTYLRQYPQANVICCAPTNKAKIVLSKTLDTYGLSTIPTATIYQLLKLKLDINDHGEEIVLDNPTESADINAYDLVILDESSMINNDIWMRIVKAYRKGKMICLGDPCQLKPVKSMNETPIFKECDTSVTLTKVVRYTGDLLELASYLRNHAKDGKPVYDAFMSNSVVFGDGTVERYNTREQWLSRLLSDFRAMQQSWDTINDLVACAWTNKAVAKINESVRNAIYTNDEMINEDEFIIINRPWFIDYDKSYPASTILQCHDIYEDAYLWDKLDKLEEWLISDKAFHIQGVEAWYKDMCDVFTCKRLMIEDGDSYYEAKMLVPTMLEIQDGDKTRTISTFDLTLKSLKEICLALKKNRIYVRRYWQMWYGLRNAFLDWGYTYALTIHKLQGSTYKKVYMNAIDCFANKTIEDRNQLLYTGVTRAKNTLAYYG